MAAGLFVWCMGRARGPAAAGTDDSVQMVLDDYSAGRFDEAVKIVAPENSDPARLGPFREAFKREAPLWAEGQGPDREPFRRMVAATFALEVAEASYRGIQHESGLSTGQSLDGKGQVRAAHAWDQVGPLLEWACAWVRHLPPSAPLERDWFVASVQVVRDFWDRSESPWPVPGAVGEYGRARAHLADAIGRHPDEPWFRVVVAERLSAAESVLGKESAERVIRAEYASPGSRSNRDFSVLLADQRLSDLLEMRKLLTPLEGAPSVRAEVHVHLGCIAIICGELARARAYLADVDPWTTDPCTRYLGHFLLGRADDEDGHLADAERDYRAALAALPDVPSGLTALAGVLAMEGHGLEADGLARRVFLVPPTTVDPAFELWKGTGCTRWPAAISALREGLTRQ